MPRQRGPSPTSSGQLANEVVCGIELWRAARRWRRQVETSLARLGLTLPESAVLLGTDTVIHETDEAASQNAVATCAHIDKVTVSKVMKALEGRGLIDRVPAAQGRAYRVWITRRGLQVLTTGTARVHAASRASFEKLGRPDARLIAMLRRVA